MWQRQVFSWADYRLVVEDHAEHRTEQEGEGASPYQVASSDYDDSNSDKEGGNSESNSGSGDSDDDGEVDQGYQPQTKADESDGLNAVALPCGAADSHDSAQAVDDSSPSNIESNYLR